MKAVGAAGATAAGAASVAAAQDDSDVAQTFRLDGVADYWIGRAPERISGVKNPTLNLEAGKKYRVVWENLDGRSHNFSVYTTKGNLVVFSPYLDAEGDTQTVEFVATENMVQYYCDVHYLSMRGDIEVEGQTQQEPDPVDAGYFPKGPKVGLKEVASGFSYPVAMKAPEGEDRLFVADQPGQIYVLDRSEITGQQALDVSEREPFIDISDRIFHEAGPHPETGLLGLAFHPNFQQNQKFYVRYSAPVQDDMGGETHHASLVSEFEADPNLEGASPDTEKIVLAMPSPGSNHNSGNISFGPDGLLYVPIGDGGFGGDTGDMQGHVTGGNGQDIYNNLLGSILRIDVDGSQNVRGEQKEYAIPDGNPLVGQAGLDEHYAWGFRNPWGMSFGPNGRLFVGDVGRALYEEVDIVEKGGNYGWRLREGKHCFDPYSQGNPPKQFKCADTSYPPRSDPLLDPILEYPHVHEDKPVGQAVVGGHVYTGEQLPDLQDKYVFGDWSFSPVAPHGTLLVATESEETGVWGVDKLRVVTEGLSRPDNRISRFVISFGEDQAGELYVLTSETFLRQQNEGSLYKLVPAGEGRVEQVNVNATERPAANETTETDGTETTIQNETAANDVGRDLVSRARAPGFGASTALGGLGGFAALQRYLGDDD
ncbi:PQQ-dependent sugar dehydrogenase [Halorussus sp. MSC15.2]|uniref:PQQ-dependent sugar dehydrogenase n=1 Tax=Halorussus sp. MSC15.2 TaxID=2283638 RepID=UPI0013D3E608|nr:PQQ-dependent sugar dehydrogenase [Halorussus sp. MSC15.2]NEU57645.1 PQQ-dependent sugar dehydrogenase [Halorussus sp. MSC15.2]